QGGAFELIVEYDWLMALEQPTLPPLFLGPVPRLMDESYITRFGFLPNPKTHYDPAGIDIDRVREPAYAIAQGGVESTLINNPDRLPVGFARDSTYVLPTTGERLDVIGFTCAACHVGQVNFQGTGIRIDGGPAMTNLTKFQLAVGYALALTYYVPTRFDRFATAVLDPHHSAAARTGLRVKLKALIEEGETLQKAVESRHIYSTRDGFGRLDALGRIGNFVFAEELDDRNLSLSNAPVSFPPIWDTPWFEWVQYNGSIMRPMIRNAGEAMGVFARVNFQDLDDPARLFSSTVKFLNLFEMESLIRGDAPFEGLRAPVWPEDVLPPVDRAKAARGARLYEQHCQPCHLPAPTPSSPLFTDDRYWTPEDAYGNRYLKLNMKNIYQIGTDSLQASNFARRIVEVGTLGEKFRDQLSEGGGGLLMAGEALPFLVQNTIEKGYEDLGITPADSSLRDTLNGLRPNSIRAPLAYKARPLDGVWATAPYLHNGSVPTLYQL
ncbi:MAG: cytochrome c, partial [Rhodothermales bacterium]